MKDIEVMALSQLNIDAIRQQISVAVDGL